MKYIIPESVKVQSKKVSPAFSKAAGVRWTPLPKAEAPTEPAGETQSPCRIPKALPLVACEASETIL